MVLHSVISLDTITDASHSNTHVISFTLGGCCLIEGTYVGCRARVSCS